MALHSLRARLLVIQSALVVGLTIVTLAYVSVRANRVIADRLTVDLARSRESIGAALDERYQRVELVAQLVASVPELKNLLTNTDAKTIREWLSDFRQRHRRDELLIVLDGAGQVVARSDTFAPLAIPDVEGSWMAPALAGHSAHSEIDIDGRVHLAAFVPSEAGGTVFGFVLAGAPVNDALAASLRDVGDRNVVMLSPRGVVASTLPARNLPWRSSSDVEAMVADPAPRQVEIDGEAFEAVLVKPKQSTALRIVSLQSRDRALAPYRSIQVGLLVLGLLAAGLGIGGSAVVARSLTAPIGRLADATRQVAAGNLDVTLPVTRDDEIGRLSRSFEEMTAGLRERADMQKFVSQSTVEMIHSHHAERQAGERRTLTLLFSDIRGFTNFADGRSPEDAVRVLNRHLRLQADLVKRFHGDVDKFMGDAVFAHFSGPDMALDAIRCAVEIHHAVAAVSRTDASIDALAVGIGIATGDVVLGSIGSDDRLDYTAIGPAVNLSSRLCAHAEAHETLISQETFALVRDIVAAEPVAPLAIKGFSAPVPAYRMLARTM
jgi:class 3 adenylate cyclase